MLKVHHKACRNLNTSCLTSGRRCLRCLVTRQALVDQGPDEAPRHLTVANLPEQLRAGDLLVVNETSVIPARLPLRKPTGGAVEVFLVEPAGAGWTALIRPARRVKSGTQLRSDRDGALEVLVGDELGEDGRRTVQVFHDGQPILKPTDCYRLSLAGESPLPPYITQRAFPRRVPDRYARTRDQ